jgi:caa(3)-type oxidase subunit IV
MSAHDQPATPGVIAKPQTKEIWNTFWILLIATTIEFVIAFTMTHGIVRVSIFLGLTVIKAFYIVGNFMHLRHEVKSLIWTIILPTVFVIWLIVICLAEGTFALNAF